MGLGVGRAPSGHRAPRSSVQPGSRTERLHSHTGSSALDRARSSDRTDRHPARMLLALLLTEQHELDLNRLGRCFLCHLVCGLCYAGGPNEGLVWCWWWCVRSSDALAAGALSVWVTRAMGNRLV